MNQMIQMMRKKMGIRHIRKSISIWLQRLFNGDHFDFALVRYDT